MRRHRAGFSLRGSCVGALMIVGSILAPTAAYAWGTNAKTTGTETRTEKAKQSTSDAAITTKVKAAMAKENGTAVATWYYGTEYDVWANVFR